ncbi:hypothetical protein [Neorhodopirellula pilleata]|uniref:Transmembrane protein n=1 Tax=Neorhodopirellula pilleata TaxID=2714738 RepID=A0A5C5ZYQ1_9BACT|nr:hypothetical protein [Neorhodopirellula pilleata]TWT92240.1 hypothetical protein Pla100_47770 [Neorhodopirellula pilleata]
MNAISTHCDHEDWRLLGWIGIWSLAFLVVIASLLKLTSTLDDLTDDSRFVLGFAMGGLAVTWTAAATWAALIHLPSASDPTRQRVRSRIAVAVIGIVEIVYLGWMSRPYSSLFVEAVLSTMVATAGPILVWQWTRRRIHRTEQVVSHRRKIRHLMEMTFIIAIIAAVLNWGCRWPEISTTKLVVIVSNAFVWTFVLSVILGRWWPSAVLAIPILISQLVVSASLVESMGQAGDGQIEQNAGTILGFHFFTFLLLILMRSSNHRWIGSEKKYELSSSPN